MFNIIVDYPESTSALQDLKVCTYARKSMQGAHQTVFVGVPPASRPARSFGQLAAASVCAVTIIFLLFDI